jgi:peptidoglycan hydrolase-like protein with peptidoglycan-binding domain
MRFGRKLGAALLATAAAGAALVATSAPAQAAGTATPDCTKVKTQYVGNGWYLNTPGNDTSRPFTCYLEYGDNNAAVRWLQYSIQYCYDSGDVVVDGKYGSQTRSKVRIIQGIHGVPQTGIYGPQTRSGMYWRLYNPTLKVYSTNCYSPV